MKLGNIDKFNYLGFMINGGGRDEAEIEERNTATQKRKLQK